ncbi:MAG: hypothetical protein ACKOWM_00100 [Sphingomonadales bacterium]
MRIVAEHPDLRRQYEQIVASQKRFGFFSQIWVQDALHPNWVYVLNDQHQILLRIPVVRKFGLKAYLQPLFIRDLDLLADLSAAQCNDLTTFLRRRSFLHLNISINNNELRGGQTGKFQKLELSGDIDLLRAGYSENVKRSLKKAKDLQLQEISFSDFQSFFIKQKGEDLGNLNAAAWLRLEKLAAAASKKDSFYCCGTYAQKELLAVGLFFKWKKQLYFIKGTLNDQGKKCGALVFLIDAVLEKHVPSFEALDFIGSNQESIAAFYKKFGAIDHRYMIIKGRVPFV